MDITIERRTIDAMTIVALRGVIPTYSDERLLWDRMMPELVRQGVTPNSPCGVIEHDREYTECDVDQEIFVLVAPGTQVATPLMIHELPARDCLVARLVGPYEGITQAYNLLAERIAEDGLVLMGGDSLEARNFSFYLTTPDEVPADQLVTEVCIPLT